MQKGISVVSSLLNISNPSPVRTGPLSSRAGPVATHLTIGVDVPLNLSKRGRICDLDFICNRLPMQIAYRLVPPILRTIKIS